MFFAFNTLGAVDFNYQVTLYKDLDASKDQIVLKIATLEPIYYPCPIVVNKLNLVKPLQAHLPLDAEGQKTMGEISMDVQISECPGMQLEAPAEGFISFQRGVHLPYLFDGEYQVVVNGKEKGLLVIHDQEIGLKPVE